MTETTRSPAGDVLTNLVLAVFRLNGDFLQAAAEIAAPAGLTAARWQVLGAIIEGPLPVAEIARRMGLARQGVQRLADILVAEGRASYAENPGHKRAKLVVISPEGLDAIARLRARQHRWANDISEGLAPDDLAGTLALIRELARRVEDRLAKADLPPELAVAPAP